MPIPRIILFILLALSGLRTAAQQQFYLYIQSSASQPFYARIQTSIYSSSENGYMIVPKLHDSTYGVFIGFARNAYPEQHFVVDMNKQDQGFELRKLSEKGWGLFNLQTMAMIPNSASEQKQVSDDNTGERKSDLFSQMLANVVNDSSILYTAAKPVPTQPARKPPAAPDTPNQTAPDTAMVRSSPPQPQPVDEKKPFTDSVQTAKATAGKKDSVAETEKQVATATAAAPPVQEKKEPLFKKGEAPEKPFITRIAEQKTEEGYKAVYLEQYILTTDTIDVEIPLREGTPVSRKPLPQPPVTQQPVPDTTTGSKPAPAPVSPVSIDTVKKKAAVLVTNSDCKSFATDTDVDKLRIKLIAENAIDDKLVVARKIFKTKCFSAKQIKALTELFPNDESKYRFFDAAYPFVSDTENFSTLEEMIENEYYKNRFKAMIRK